MWLVNIRIGFFLALRQIRHASFWTTAAIIFIMMLTFLNLVFVTGILVGLPVGAVNAFKQQFTADLIITALQEKLHIENGGQILSILDQSDAVESYASRYVAIGDVQANYRDVLPADEQPDHVRVSVTGIDPLREDMVTHLSDRLMVGEYLYPSDTGYILVGSELVDEYSMGVPGEGDDSLDIKVGDKVRVTIGANRKEFIVKGILNSKVQEIDRRMFVVDKDLRRMLSRPSSNLDEIVIKLQPNFSDQLVKNDLLAAGIGEWAQIKTSEEALGSFLDDIINTFSMLGNLIGAIGLVVASITIFIVIFINALTRKKYIGILKAIGISKSAIEMTYIFQALFYTLVGSTLATLILFLVLKPYIDAHPIDYPFADGILVIKSSGVIIRFFLILVASFIAGYIPAKLVVKGNTLDAILGR